MKEQRSMEYDCSPSPAKRRNIMRENHTDHSESNKVQNTEEISNTDVVVEQGYAINDGEESLMEGIEIDRCDFEQENNKSMDKIVVEESKLDATEESLMEDIQIDRCDFEQENNKSKNKIVVEESNLDATEASLMEDIQIDRCDFEQENNESMDKIVMEESKLDATEANNNQIKNEDNSCGDNSHPHLKKKLLVLDVNGLLVDIVADPDEAYKPDKIIGSKAVFKRPFCDEFLKFCFERFNVGVWTSRTRRNIEQVLKFLAINTQQLLFCWDQFHCTQTGFNTIENSGKPLVLKELKKLWEKKDRNLPWDRGVYNESNTIFLDDSPYKALRNPPHTAIFPYSYSYRDTQDNGLGPNGDLRNYLERLAASDNVQKFIEKNPFGQQPITYDDESWYFYRKIIGPTKPKASPSRSRRKLIIIEAGGLLVDIATVPREGFKADIMQGSRAVFKRPYCDEFLQFCFKRFNVGFWTSTSRYNMEGTLDFLMGDAQHKLLFCWDASHCTNTGFSTVENSCKTIFLKELRKLWEKKDLNLPWEIGEYDESNTLLVESTPHKALLNPPHTAIFPHPYRYWNTEDNSLGPKGDLRVYLERLAASDNVQKFVSDNPFGLRPITEKNLSWRYYKRVIDAFPSKFKARANGLVSGQCKNSSEPKPDTALAAPTLLEPKVESTTVLAAPTLLEPKAEPTTVLAASTLLEPKAESTTVLAAPTLLEPKAESTTVLAASTLLEQKAESTTVLAAPTLLEPKAESTTVSAAPALLEPKAESTVSAAPTLLEPKAESTTVSAAPN
ncbi:hypothetical protein L1987_53135 [Smallanthus sonchifolius]|uniref:Uncharacterized protein n=1 Tax=Smallanthus sonchifolius TaxID=185202 RepID=A0ACB9EV13_9ASTR|nr:hypothetical protein L1987_53135 [Smallanthus sonchifolius]